MFLRGDKARRAIPKATDSLGLRRSKDVTKTLGLVGIDDATLGSQRRAPGRGGYGCFKPSQGRFQSVSDA